MDEETPIDSVDALAEHVSRLKDAAVSYLTEQSKAREMAMDYYAGKMVDLPAEVGRSQAVANVLRAQMKKVMPSVIRTILSGGNVVEYTPVGPEDEEGAQQATDYVNTVCIRESDVERAIYDAIHDAMLLKTGILKWSAYRQRKVTIQDYTDQPDEALLGLVGDPSVEILEHKTSEETDPQVLALDPNARRHSFKLRRVTETVTPKLEAIPRGAFLITPGADSIEEAELCGEEIIQPRSDFVSMGYDKDMVWQIEAHDGGSDDDQSRMQDDYSTSKAETRKALELIRVWELYVKVDQDGDGIAECYRIVFGDNGADSNKNVVLGLEPVDEAPYASVVIERDPHQFEGHSLYEDLRNHMRIKTAILRATLDNTYATNNLRPAYRLDAVANPESLSNGKFGEPIILNAGFTLDDAIKWEVVPFVADKSFQMMEYLDTEANDMTGITDASGGLDPESLQDVTAAAAQLASEKGIAQADLIVRSIANDGLRKAFRGLLRLVIAHADGPRTVRMKGKWVQYDPRVWNADMDCVVNVGLGGGTKERDLQVLQVIYGLQKELLLSMGPDNVFVKPDQLYNTLSKITETAGFPSAQPYFTDPDPQEVQAKLDEQKNAPNPDVVKIQEQGKVNAQLEQMKAQTTVQLEQAKLEIAAQSERMKAEVARDKEMAQMQADLATKQHDAQMQAQLEAQKIAFEREKFGAEMSFKERELAMKRELELLKLDAQDTPDGVKSKADMRESGLTDAMSKMLDTLAKANGPKRVVRDANGDVVGVEPVN